MKEYLTSAIRNVALVSHNGAGKSTLVERLLFDTGATTRMGSVQAGTAAMDFEEEEKVRNSSVSLAVGPIEWRDVKINLLDTPGYIEFVGEVNSALRVVEGVMVLVEAVAGVEVGTELVWQTINEMGLPRVILVNKMNRENVRVTRVLNSIKENLEGRFVQLQVPIGEGPSFKGVVDLISMQARLGHKDERGPIPADLQDAVDEARMALVEAAAEGDDDLLEKYFAEEELTMEEIVRGIKSAVKQGLVTPIMFAAPEAGIAIIPVLEALRALIPAPDEPTVKATKTNDTEIELKANDSAPLAAFVFKTVEDRFGKLSYLRLYSGKLSSDSRVWDSTLNAEVRVGTLNLIRGAEHLPISTLHAGDIGAVVKLGETATNNTICDRANQIYLPPIVQPEPLASVSVEPISQADVAKLNTSLTRLTGEDLTLRWKTEMATHQTILSGMGTVHLDIAVKKMQSKFGVGITTHVPKVPYKETITKIASTEYTHKKQTGGAGQYARVFLRLEPITEDTPFEFTSEIFGGSVSGPFVAATEKGCRAASEEGVLAGYPTTGVKVVIYDGKEHPVDSKEIAFQIAGREGFKQAVMNAAPALLEPIYEATVTVPADNMGDVMSDFNTRRGRVMGMDQQGNKSIVRAEVPLAEMQTYMADLRSMTQGRGVFNMKFLHYGRVPGHLQEQLVAKLRTEHKKEEE
ncbi:MAG: elongation factor G [Chloroflexi bacterium]|nr:elongation factor G [Chloroflexota bacterium]MBP8054930.1 elongation factor G [Chloroflexota bacterium]